VIVAGLVKDAIKAGAEVQRLEFFTLAWVGVPAAIAGLAYMVIAGRWLLPTRDQSFRQPTDPRAYTVEMLVEAGGGVAGRTIEEAGLRQLD